LKKILILPVFAIFIICLFFAQSASALSVVATIGVGSTPRFAAYDSGKGEIFVTQDDGTVSVIRDSDNTVVATTPVGSQPLGVAYDSGKGEIFVANEGAGFVSVISDSTNAVFTTIPVGSFPSTVAYDSGKGRIFVANNNGADVSVISDATNTVIATIPVGVIPSGIAYDSEKRETFVASAVADTVSVISDATNAVVATIPVGISPAGIAYDSGKGELFVAITSAGQPSVAVISDTEPARDVTASNLRIADSFGNIITGAVHTGQQIQVVLDLKNNQNTDQPIAYLVQIQNEDKITVNLSWITGTLTAGQSSTLGQSWTPSYSGSYSAQVFVLQSIDNPVLLSHPMMEKVLVKGGKHHDYDSSAVIVSGTVNPPFHKGVATLLIFDPNNNLINVARADVASDGTFSKTIKAGGPLFTVAGTYTVKVEFRGALQNNLSFSCSSVSPISCS